MRERGILFAMLAGLGAATYHSSGPSAASAQPRSLELVAQEPHSAESEFATTLTRFDKYRSFQISRARNGSCRVTSHPESVSSARGDAFDWAIAIVPDPEHSNLRLDFDREIEAIQLATVTEGYQFERYWFPWRTDPPLSNPTSYIIHSEYEGPKAKADGTIIDPKGDDRGNLPGVLLFRHESKRPLALFLVSESPTGGIAPEEFRTAVCIGQELAVLDDSSGDRTLRVIGPGLSGSLASLSILVHVQQQPFTDIAIRTWTADHGSHNRFRDSFSASLGPQPHLDFKPLEVDSLPAVNRFVKYIRKTWHDNTPVVLLTEEATAYGAAAPRKGEASPENASDKEIEDLQSERIFRVPFPRNLSQLRNATEKQDHLPGFGDDSRRAAMPRNGLLLSLKEEARASLEIPTFSKEQTPLSQESQLFTIGSLLKTGVIHYAGILATDPLDTLFLARYLRSASPNLRVFTLNPDLLLEHGSDSFDYSGIIGLSTYPLCPLSQVWGGRKKDTIFVFPSETSEAIYNATVAALHPANDSREADRRDTTDPFTGSSEPLWITVAGHNGFEPIAIQDAHEAHATKQTEPHFPPEYWPGWGYAFSILLSLCGGFCLLMLFARPEGHRVFALFSSRPDQYDVMPGHDPLPRAFYLFLTGMCLTVLAAVWLVVPGIVVEQNLTPVRHMRFEISGALVALSGVFLITALSLISGKSLSRRGTSVTLPDVDLAGRPVAIAGLSFVFAAPYFLRPSQIGVTGLILHLWLFFIIGCFFAGATLAAAVLPFWKALHVEAEKCRTNKFSRFANAPYFWGAIAVGMATACIISFAAYTVQHRQSTDFLAAYRSLDLTNGVSPLVPLTLLFTALIVFSFVHLRRMAYYEERRPDLPAMKGDKFCPKLDAIVSEIDQRIQGFQGHPLYWVAFALLVALSIASLTGSAQTLEERALEILIMCGTLAVGCSIFLVWILLVLLWSAFSEFLQELERHPIRQVFSLFPRGFMWSPVWQGAGKKRTHVAITRSLECMYALKNHPRTPPPLKDAIERELSGDTADSLSNNVEGLLAASAARTRFSRSRYRALETALARVAQLCVEYLRKEKWERGDYELKSELAVKEENKAAFRTLWPEYQLQEPATICGELVAFRFLAYINFVLWHIDNLVMCLSGGFLLLVLALNAYAFRSRTIFDWLLVLLFGILTIGVVIVFAQLDRDAVLSRITGTEEGKLDRHFFTHLISYGGVPALVLLSTHFPTIGRFFFSWVKPALEAIH